jgi:hypothetical protein
MVNNASCFEELFLSQQSTNSPEQDNFDHLQNQEYILHPNIPEQFYDTLLSDEENAQEFPNS